MKEPNQPSAHFWRLRASVQNPDEAPGSPSADDLRLFTAYAEHLRYAQTIAGKPGLVLGTTRQTVDWCRSNGLRVAVMDFCEPAVRNLESIHKDWDGLEFIMDDWLTTAHADNSFSWAAGDGVVNAAGSGRNAIRLLQQVFRMLLPGSIFFLRNMLRPFPTPAPSDVFAKLAAGQIQCFCAFRHQLLQSLQSSFMDGILTRMGCRVIRESGVLCGDPKKRFGWHSEQLMRLDYWAAEGASLCYPTLAELRNLVNSGFEELDISHGGYEMADLSPTLAFRRRTKEAPWQSS